MSHECDQQTAVSLWQLNFLLQTLSNNNNWDTGKVVMVLSQVNDVPRTQTGLYVRITINILHITSILFHVKLRSASGSDQVSSDLPKTYQVCFWMYQSKQPGQQCLVNCSRRLQCEQEKNTFVGLSHNEKYGLKVSNCFLLWLTYYIEY